MLVNHGGTATQPRAPGHERPFAALRAAKHGRLSAATRAPGANIPPATAAGAPGQYCQSAAPRAPGHGRPLAIPAGVFDHDRLSAALLAPGAVVASAVTAEAPRQHRLSADAPIATVAPPAGHHRPHQEGLPYTPANPRILTRLHTHQDNVHAHALYRRATSHAQSRTSGNPPSPNVGEGPGVRSSAHPPPPSASCHPSTAPPAALLHRGHGLPPFSHPSRAPPLPRTSTSPLHHVESEGRVIGQRRTTPGTIRAALARQGVRPSTPSAPRTPTRAL